MSLQNSWNNGDRGGSLLSPDLWLEHNYGIGKDGLKVQSVSLIVNSPLLSKRLTITKIVLLYLCSALSMFAIGYLFFASYPHCNT